MGDEAFFSRYPAEKDNDENRYDGGGKNLHVEPLAVGPGKVAYSNGCEARPGRSSQPLGSESLNR